MIFLEDLTGTGELEMIIRALAPWQLGDPLEIRADDLRFHRLSARPLEPTKLPLGLGTCFLGQLELRQLLAEFGDLL